MQNKGEIYIYQTEDGKTKLSVNLQNETVWLSLDQMAELFQRDKSTVSRHIKNVALKCDAKNCLFNSDGKCRANGITVVDDHEKSRCASFIQDI